MRWWSLVMLVWSSLANAGNPALVTFTSGDVEVTRGDARAPAAGVPFLVHDDEVLTLAKDARVVVMFDHTAKQLVGPSKHRVSELMVGVEHGPANVAPIEALLNKAGVFQPPTNKRGGVAVLRPVPGAAVSMLTEIRWKGGSTQVDVVIRDLVFDAELWRGRGAGLVKYDGPSLPPGKYILDIAGDSYSFSIASSYELDQVAAAAKAAREALGAIGVTDAPAILSVQAGALVAIGLGGEAIELLDKAAAKDPSLVPLRDAYATKLGVGP